jgi:PAS domain S-box-containing protein
MAKDKTQGLSRKPPVIHEKDTAHALARHLSHAQALAKFSHILLMDENPAASLDRALEELLESSSADRIYIFRNFIDSKKDLCTRMTHEVCAPGIHSERENTRLQHVSYALSHPRWIKTLGEGTPVKGLVHDFPPEEQKLLSSQDIVSILILPLYIQGQWEGFIGFDDTHNGREWDEEDIALLRTAAHMIGSYLIRKTALGESQRYQARLNALLSLSHAFLQRPTFEDAARDIIQQLQTLTGACSCMLIMEGLNLSSETTVIEMPTAGNTRSRSFEQDLSRLRDEHAKNASPVFISRLTLSAADLAGFEDDAILAAPIIINGYASGFLIMSGGSEGFSNEDVQMLAAFAEFVTIARMNSRTLKSLDASEKKFRTVAQSANDAIISTDTLGRIIFWNPMAEGIFGYKEGEARDLNIAAIIPDRFLQAFRNEMNKILQQARKGLLPKSVHMGSTADIIGRRKIGSEFPMEISISTWESEGAQYFTYIIRDITERKRLENSLKQETEKLKETKEKLTAKNRELENANQELKTTQAHILQQEKMASIGQLAAGVAHEINNPMGFISSNLGSLDKYVDKITDFLTFQDDFLKGICTDEHMALMGEKKKTLKVDYILQDIKELVKESQEGAQRVKKIVSDLKGFSRSDQSEFKHADINECMESTINIVWNELKYKTQVIRDYGTLPFTKCYPQQLNQVFMNLLVNAAHAIEKQGIITVSSSRNGDSIRVSVSDTGSGIPEEIRQRIFEPFFTTKEMGKGTGLGLSITYDIVKKHGGDIRVESEVGKGTTFTVSIPIVEER